MLLRIALAIVNSKQKKELINRLIGLSMVMKIEFNIAEYTCEFDKMIKNMQNSDMIFMDEEYINTHKEKLYLIYKCNNKCFPVFLGLTKEKICDFLAIRPIEYIENAENINPENKDEKIRRLCDLILDNIKKDFDDKTDNSVIYVTTKQESFALKKESIIY